MGSFECTSGTRLEGWRGKQRESQRQTSQLDEIQWAVALPSVRRAVATGIIDKASVVVAVVIAGEIIIEIVAQPLRGPMTVRESHRR